MNQTIFAYGYVWIFGSLGVGWILRFLGMSGGLAVATSVCLLFALCNVLYILTHPGPQ